MRRALLIGIPLFAFLAAAFLVARWINNDSVERAAVEELLQAQIAGDAPGMLRRLECADVACAEVVRANAKRLRTGGELKIALYQSQTAHAPRSRTKPTRVVWYTDPDNTIVQCVLVRRTGDILAGTSVSLLRLSAPIGREASCPKLR